MFHWRIDSWDNSFLVKLLRGFAVCLTSILIQPSLSLTAQPRPNTSSQLQVITAQSNSQAVTINAGQQITHQLSPGEIHTYQLSLSQRQYARVSVEQRGIDLVARLLAPDGRLIADVNSVRGTQGDEVVEIVAAVPGPFRIEIVPSVPKASGGSYSIQLLEIRDATANETLLQQARELYYESLQLNDQAKLDKAVEVATQALKIRQKVLGPSHPEVAASLRALGAIYLNKRDRPRAQGVFQSAEPLTLKISGEQSLDYADVLSGLAELSFNRGEHEQAEQLNLRALSIREKIAGPDGLPVASSLFNLALLYRALSDLSKSEQFYLRAISIREKWLGPDHLDVALLLNNLGLLYYGAGDYDRAESTLLRSLAIRENAWGENHRQVASALGNLGLVEWKRGNYEKAEAYHRRAISISEKVGDNFNLAASLHNLAILFKESQKDYVKAEEYYLRSLAIYEKLFGDNDSSTANVVTSLGILYQVTDLDRAIQFHLRAQAIYERVLGPSNYYTLLSLRSLAIVYALKHDFAQSAVYQDRVNALEEKLIALNLIVGSERQKILYFRQLESAERLISLHVNLAPDNASMRDHAVTKLLQRKGRVLDALAENLAALRQRSTPEDQALLDSLRDTTSRLARLSLSGPQKTPVDEYQSQLRTLETERERLEIEISRRSKGFYEVSRSVTLAAVKAAIPNDAALIEFASYRPRNELAAKPSEEKGDPRYIAYIIRQQGEVQWVELGDGGELDAQVAAFRKALRDPANKHVDELGRALDEILMRPVRKLAGSAKHLLISPDGALNLIPFEALVDERGHYLVEHYSLAYLTSGRDLLRLQVKRDSKTSPVVIADPAFGSPALVAADSGGTGERIKSAKFDYSKLFFGPSPGIGVEVEALRKSLPNAAFFTKEQATEATLKQVKAPSILHVATHGFFLRAESPDEDKQLKNAAGTRLSNQTSRLENPLLRSGLALAGANQGHNGDDDGVLTALEASALDLWGTKLVVLSACDTGVGEVKNGDGVYGLRRALFLAGTESQLMSLWPVSDRSTRDLMADYYRGLVIGVGRGEALRKVQLQMLLSKSRRHPYYWASFILAGEWGNLKGQR